MYKIGDYVVFRRNVCIVKEINTNYYNNLDYYKLEPVNERSLKIDVPVNNKYIRDIINKNEINKIIDSIPSIDSIDVNSKYLENDYKRLMQSGNYEDLIKIIKTTYLRNKERIDNKKKATDKDLTYFKKAEEYLYTEFAVSLGVSYDEAKKYVIDRVNKVI